MTVGRNRRLEPGSTIGILGGGQLGRMTALAAAPLGFRTHIFCPERDSPASEVATVTTVAAYDDNDALDRFAHAVDVVTFEFENVPFESAARLDDRVPVRPGPQALRLSQDRALEKAFIEESGAPVVPWRAVTGPNDLADALGDIPPPAVLKSARFGYDGKGQVLIERGQDPDDAWTAMGGDRGILEGFIAFEREISVIVGRGMDAETACYVPVENRHANHILDRTIAPAPVTEELAAQAEGLAIRIADALDLVGLLAVEMFVTPDAGLLVNEIAPRPHNSGHWTIDACLVSQFEQFVRAVAGLPLGDPARHSDAEMRNLLGDEVESWHTLLTDRGSRLHLYGKREARSGRKMGHVTRLRPLRSLRG